MGSFYEEGLKFSCKECGWCCSFPGGAVYCTNKEFKAIADHLNMDLNKFMFEYTCIVDDFPSLSSREDGPCIFYDKGCKIYEVRPLQCRLYPFWTEVVKSKHRWQEEAKNCKGINKGELHSKEVIEKSLSDNRWNLLEIWREKTE